MNGSISIDWVSVVVALVIVALLAQGYRMAPGSRIGLGLRAVAAVLIVLIVALLAWNIVAVALFRSR